MEYGIIGIIVLALDVWALINVWGSGSSLGGKLIWTLIILVLPLVGMLLWFFVGPKSAKPVV